MTAALANTTTWCECGNRKGSSAAACHRCAYLDGLTPKMHFVIDALRGTDGLTLSELCEAVDGCVTPSTYRAMQRTTKTLLEQHRLRRYWHEDAAPDEIAIYGIATKAGAAICGWKYALFGRGEGRSS